MELLYASQNAGTALSNVATETILNDSAGMGSPMVIPANFFANARTGRSLKIIARGIMATVATAPTLIFRVRTGIVPQTLTNSLLSMTAATTTAIVSAGTMWEIEGDIVVQQPGSTATARGTGFVFSAGFPSPFMLPMWGGAASPGTQTFDTTTAQNLSITAQYGTASASNTCQLLQLLVYGQN